MSTKSTRSTRSKGKVPEEPAPGDKVAANDSVVVVTTEEVLATPPSSSTQVNSSLLNVASALNPYAPGFNAAGKTVTSAIGRRQIPIRRKERKRGFNCQLCDKPDGGSMVQCDGDGCDEWFHFECVDVSDAVADVTWFCPFCNADKNISPVMIKPPTDTNTNPSGYKTPYGQQQGGTKPAKGSTGKARSKASSVSSVTSSEVKRMRALELKKLEEQFELEKKFLEKKYTILMDFGSETSTVISELEEIPKIQDWVDETDRHGEEYDSGLVDEVNGNASINLRQPEEHQAPNHNQRENRSFPPGQPGQPLQGVDSSQRADVQHPSNGNRQSYIPTLNRGSTVGAIGFDSAQGSTPLGHPPAPRPPTPVGHPPAPRPPTPRPPAPFDETVCILNRSQIAARQAVSKDLPEFSGNPEDWPLFFSMFNSSTQMCGFSNEENMLRLRKCLKGKALEAVRCRLLHPSNVAGVMSTLKMLYGRPEAIVQAIVRKIRALPPPNMERLETVVNFALTVENLVATIQACEVSDFVYNSSLRYELVERLPSSLKMDWAKYCRGKSNPTLIHFSAWLYTMAEDASAVMVTNSSSEQRGRGGKKDGFLNFHSESESPSTRSAETSSKPKPSGTVAKEQCPVCKGTCPSVAKCKRFGEFSYDSKWATLKECKLCRKCLRKHNGSCKQAKPCGTNGCEFLHHPLLHNPQRHEAPRSSPPTAGISNNSVAETRTDRSCNVHQGQSEVLFRIVPVMLYGPTKTIRTYAFVDDGSELTLIEQSLADELEAQGPTKSLCLKWTGGTQKMEKQSQQINLQISGVHNSKKYELSGIYTMSSLQIRPQTLLIEEIRQKYPHLAGLPIDSYHDVSPRILIGLDHARLGHAIKSREGKDHEPIAVKTRLGWMVFGSCTGKEKAERYVNYHSVQTCECNRDPDEDLHRTVKAYFSLDSLGVVKPDKLLVSQQDQRAQTLLETRTRRTDGRYETGLLWKYEDVRLPDSEAMALKRWRCLNNRMAKDSVLAEALKAKIDDHVSKGYVRKLTAEELQAPRPRVWYLPIFPVVNPNKPGKTRLVWDAAATVHGVSLNTVLLKGPDQLTSLLSVLVQFREFRVAVCGDIREMFHQVKMREEDQHCQRFFWKDDDQATEPSVFVVQVMTFGACCSPSTAQYVKNSNAKRFERDHPEAVDAIVKRHYVDDMLVSVETAEEAVQLVKDVKEIHTSAGFEMRNWISNSHSVLAAVSEEATKEKSLDIGDESVTEKVLGMWWDTSKDCFTYKVSARYDEELISGNRRPTKREVLRTLMMVFDPLGFIAHVLMFLKVLLQEIWRTTVGWDDPIEDPQYDKWLSWLAIFPQIATVEIPRCYRVLTPMGADTVVQMHTFVDASESGFAAAVYLRFEHGDTVECALVGAKTRVAPLKFLSIPRSELQAAVIGVRFADTISKSLSISVSQRTFWTDSKDVLCWLRSDHRRYSQFVAFRVSEILETSDIIEWRWVPTKHNVADEGTKWKRAPNLASDSRWFRGPDFLLLPEKDWPANPFPGKTDEELRPHLLLHAQPCDPPIRPQDFSNWNKLLRVTAYVLRYLNNLKRSCYGRPRMPGLLKRQDFIDAENHLFRRAQSAAFAEETAILTRNRSLKDPVKTIPKSSLLYQWCAFLDENDVLRVKGRTKACTFIDRDAAEPVILPRDHPVTRLIISAVHERFCHQNHETVVNEILQRYRIPRLKAAYQQIRKDCQQCKILRAQPQPPEMGDLPPARLAAFTRPFTHTGVDYFGPMPVSIGRRSEKRWGVLATCLTTRAIHLQIAYTLTTDSCVMAIRNIMARRGVPTAIYSDRGTNFRAASKELQHAAENLDHDALMKEFTSSHTEWSFNPPVTPHMGGAWERLIRSVKENLDRLQTSRLPTHEVLESTLIEIENIVNSRPLTNIPIDGDDSPVLTPNHFLLGSANGLRSWVPLDDSPVLLRNSWKQSQKMADAFWKQWVRDYLPTITRRTKWFTPAKPITVGDLVIIVDPKLPRNCWPKGRVIATCPASDGQVRWATVQTASGGIYERPAVSLAVLDVGVETNTLQDPTRIPGGSVGCAPIKSAPPAPTVDLRHCQNATTPVVSEVSSGDVSLPMSQRE